MMTENYADILRVFRSYRLSSASNDFIVLKRLNDIFEENAERIIIYQLYLKNFFNIFNKTMTTSP
jgi:hypothetical protein